MRDIPVGIWVLFLAGLGVLAFLVTFVIMKPDHKVQEMVKIECLDGFEYYVRSFPTYNGQGVALAPKWDKDGRPKRCPIK